MITFIDWVAAQLKESSPFTRLRRDAAMGLKPEIPAASAHSHSTAAPWEIPKKKKKKKKRKSKK